MHEMWRLQIEIGIGASCTVCTDGRCMLGCFALVEGSIGFASSVLYSCDTRFPLSTFLFILDTISRLLLGSMGIDLMILG